MMEQIDLPLEFPPQKLDLSLPKSYVIGEDNYHATLAQISNPTVCFTDHKSGKVAKLDWSGGVLKFEGAADEAAILFISHVIGNMNTFTNKYKNVLSGYRGIADKDGLYSADKILQ